MKKYVIFDFDGTLVDSKQAFLSSWNTLAKKFNFKELTIKELESMKKLSIRERSALLNFPMYKMPIVIPKFYKLYRSSINQVELFDGIEDMLHELEGRGYKIAIISSNSKENILTFLKRKKLTSIKNILCSGSIFGKDKLINRFLKDNNLESTEVIYVGDEQRDIIACKKTGVKIIWVGWGYDSIEVVEEMKPDFQVYSPEEILKII
ncbi:HAD-IA family hydrolase [Robertmurraya korlensis]|uniref:HAD-IA family hydrolase n=1 Tax=Robertmurraya korlensis TaxID=519977 RepID=UPI002041608B|nr:HAD-IA family hydrolase [Robertmurraya korlensis]MCM3601155.1 HAD-IA family hydrolase [Robertmurraya korlensis]